MAKITKRVVDALKPAEGKDVFAWDAELRGFGVRMKPSGAASTSCNIGRPNARPGG